MADDKQDELFTVQEVAKRLRVSDKTVRTWVEQGTMKAVLLPPTRRKRYRILASTIEEILHPPQPED